MYKNLFSAISFAAARHRHQRRKGFNSIPYINHPICVASLVVNVAEIEDPETIQAALLHDVLEDTKSTYNELKQQFGAVVANLVNELTDDTSLPSQKRKRIQAETASDLSNKAKVIRIADKICNIQDLMNYPMGWTRKRKINYVRWSQEVVNFCKGVNAPLEALFENTATEALLKFEK